MKKMCGCFIIFIQWEPPAIDASLNQIFNTSQDVKGKFGLLAHIFTDEPFLHMNSIISGESGGNIFHSFLHTAPETWKAKKTLHPSVDFLLQLNMVFQIPWYSPSLALLSNSSWGNPEVVPVQAKDIMCPVSSRFTPKCPLTQTCLENPLREAILIRCPDHLKYTTAQALLNEVLLIELFRT